MMTETEYCVYRRHCCGCKDPVKNLLLPTASFTNLWSGITNFNHILDGSIRQCVPHLTLTLKRTIEEGHGDMTGILAAIDEKAPWDQGLWVGTVLSRPVREGRARPVVGWEICTHLKFPRSEYSSRDSNRVAHTTPLHY